MVNDIDEKKYADALRQTIDYLVTALAKVARMANNKSVDELEEAYIQSMCATQVLDIWRRAYSDDPDRFRGRIKIDDVS
jgi:hypothetical protein